VCLRPLEGRLLLPLPMSAAQGWKRVELARTVFIRAYGRYIYIYYTYIYIYIIRLIYLIKCLRNIPCIHRILTVHTFMFNPEISQMCVTQDGDEINSIFLDRSLPVDLEFSCVQLIIAILYTSYLRVWCTGINLRDLPVLGGLPPPLFLPHERTVCPPP